MATAIIEILLGTALLRVAVEHAVAYGILAVGLGMLCFGDGMRRLWSRFNR